jgi:Cu2+-containing amine oxidase
MKTAERITVGIRHPLDPLPAVGFKLPADGFFDGNPALDVPPAEHCHQALARQ